jgi:uncharacterized membrane protein (DUF106 family)
MGWIVGVFVLVWPWLLRALSALGVAALVIGGWRIFLAWAESIDHRGEVLVEIRNTLNEIRDELRAMRKKGEREEMEDRFEK